LHFVLVKQSTQTDNPLTLRLAMTAIFTQFKNKGSPLQSVFVTQNL